MIVDAHSPSGGFTLIEALIGLSLIGVAMLLTMSLMAQQPGIERRLDAHREVLRLMELELERMRAMEVRPQDGPVDFSGLPRPERGPIDPNGRKRPLPDAAQDLRMFAEAERLLGWRSLYRFELKATYTVGGQLFDQTLETMIFWTP